MKNSEMRILITGAAGFLGSRIARHFHDLGYCVIGLDIMDYKSLRDGQKGTLTKYYPVDLANTRDVIEVYQKIILDFEYIHVIINNASNRLFCELGSFLHKQVSDSININLKSPLLLSNLLLPSMKKYNYGRIINISSVSALNGYSTGSLYCSTKMGLITFTESLSKELRNTGVTVNAICPDSFATKNGEILAKGQKKVDKIVIIIERIITTRLNGRCFFVSGIFRKLQYSMFYIIKSFNFLRG